MVPPILGAPRREHARSPAALSVATLSHECGLFFAHFEHRVRLPLPPAWLGGTPDAPSEFVGGVLGEPKYQAFRHDLLIASFHPGHRAKWTAHELCHALVGFAFRPGAPLFFHALAAWLAELLPVALWYFFDEAGVKRCTHHQYGGPIFQAHCEACDTAALTGARRLGPRDREHLVEGRKFVDRELAAVARSRRLGRPQGTVYATIDLASDGVAYAGAHAARLRAPEMERFVAQFFGPDQGLHTTLEALEARVDEVRSAILDGKKARPWRATRWDYVAQDVGYRLLTLTAHAPHVKELVDPLIDHLATARTRAGVTRCIAQYEALYADSRGRTRASLFPPDVLFAVGYPLPRGYGIGYAQLAQGIESACPNTWAALGRRKGEVVRAFAAHDRPVRMPLGRRFAAWLKKHESSPIAELAEVEAAITHVRPRDALAAQLDGREGADDRVRLASGVEIIRVHHDVLGAPVHKVRKLRREPTPRHILIGRTSERDVDVMELPPLTAERLVQSGERGVLCEELGLDAETIDGLLAAGLLVPARYAS